MDVSASSKAMEVDSGEVKQCVKCTHFPKTEGKQYAHVHPTDEKTKALIVSQFTGLNPLANLIGLGRKVISQTNVHTVVEPRLFKQESEHPEVPINYTSGGYFKVIVSEPHKLFVTLRTACKFFHSMWKLDSDVKPVMHADSKKVSRHTTMAMLLGRITHMIDVIQWDRFILWVQPHAAATDKALEAIFTNESFMSNVFIPIDELIPAKRLSPKAKEFLDGLDAADSILHNNPIMWERSSVFNTAKEQDHFYHVMENYVQLSKNTSFVEGRVSERGIPLSPDDVFAAVKSRFHMFIAQFPLDVDSFRGVNGKRKAAAIEDDDDSVVVVDVENMTDSEPEEEKPKAKGKAKAKPAKEKKPRAKPGPKPKAKKAKVDDVPVPAPVPAPAPAAEAKHAAEISAAAAIANAAGAAHKADNPPVPAPNPVQEKSFADVVEGALKKISDAAVSLNYCDMSNDDL